MSSTRRSAGENSRQDRGRWALQGGGPGGVWGMLGTLVEADSGLARGPAW